MSDHPWLKYRVQAKAEEADLYKNGGKMSDIADELRTFEGSDALGNGDFSVCYRGAAEIERLNARVAELEAENAALQKRVAELEAQNDTLRHATNKLRAMLTELNARHEPLQRAFITAVELLNDATLTGGKDE